MKRLLQAWLAVLGLSLLALIAIPMFWGELDRDYAVMKTKADILAIDTALENFKARHGSYPNQESGLASLVGSTMKRLPKYRWGSAYTYAIDSIGKPFVYSNGANG